MQISRSFLAACAAAYCLALLPLCAADTDADLKLREALQKKINELQGQPPAPAPQPKAARAPAQIPAPVAVPAVGQTPAPVLAAPAPVDSEAIAKAREALRQKMNELETQPRQAAPPPVAPVPAAMPAPAAQPAPPVAQPVQPAAPAQSLPPIAQPAPVSTPPPAVQTMARPVLVAPTPVDSEAIAKAREALRQKMSELDMQPALEPAKPTKGNQVLMSFPKLQGPPPVVTGEKELRLQELLRKYRADQITPEEYHQQRAKILAEP